MCAELSDAVIGIYGPVHGASVSIVILSAQFLIVIIAAGLF